MISFRTIRQAPSKWLTTSSVTGPSQKSKVFLAVKSNPINNRFERLIKTTSLMPTWRVVVQRANTKDFSGAKTAKLVVKLVKETYFGGPPARNAMIKQ